MKGIRALRSTFALSHHGPSVTSQRGGVPPDAPVRLPRTNVAVQRRPQWR
jgi:hypothetical protein